MDTILTIWGKNLQEAYLLESAKLMESKLCMDDRI